MSSTILPEVYQPLFRKKEAQKAINLIKQTFSKNLAEKLNLTCVNAPLMVSSNTGVNDDLNGVEHPVDFIVKETNQNVQVIHSLAKWKRVALKIYGFEPGEGIYADMKAIRRDEETDNVHSITVDQWSWEKVITKEERNYELLQEVVRNIFEAFKETEETLMNAFPEKKYKRVLPEDIFFISSQELEDMYPDVSPKEREDIICKEKGAVFVTQVGKKLRSNTIHDGRSPDYDDWEFNGDIILWHEPLGRAIEVSSMGIRVDKASLLKQLKESGTEDRKNLLFHKMLLNGELPLTIGGGLGQSRICMYFMRAVHIGEVQCSIWPERMISEFREKGIEFL